ncbi:unnamed protein product [Didymodactylos carnosus]|nr:unnamed protein product [Didymodactylos carnosus]CAF4001834.1 unnamed protein product [Didymodactylos carnosus]
MGEVVVLLAGDFRQTLPFIPKGTMADEIKACLKSSRLWKHVIPLDLKTNMRVHLQGDASAGRFAQQLLSLGDGKHQLIESLDSSVLRILFAMSSKIGQGMRPPEQPRLRSHN